MKLTVVGCAGSYPNGESAASCYLVEHDGFALVIDMGSGALGPLHRYRDPSSIDAVMLSHLHADHFLDMCPLFVVRRYQPGGMCPPLPVYGPADTAERLQAAYSSETEPLLSEVFDVQVFPEGDFVIGPFSIRTARMDHPVDCFGMRISAGGRVLVYSGDTAPNDALVELAEGADVALFEASFREGDENPPGLHLTAKQAADHAQRAGVTTLVLTHQVAWHDNSHALAETTHFAGSVHIAHTGLSIDI
jgi:ribonuclease BN (tRNA processing enzyme)